MANERFDNAKKNTLKEKLFSVIVMTLVYQTSLNILLLISMNLD